MAREVINKSLGKGIVTIPADAEQIPQNAAQDSLGWISTDGHIELTRGKAELDPLDPTASNPITGEGYGNKQDGNIIMFRKQGTEIQYRVQTAYTIGATSHTTSWSSLMSGLTSTAEYTFSSYQSAAGTFMYISGVDGIYKVHTAVPNVYCTMYDATKNYKGKSKIFNSRMFLWDTPTDKTGLYLSHIDKQDSSVYTTVTAEVIPAASSGTLAFKAGDAKRTCFGTVFTIGGETFTDNLNGILVGSSGGTGSINYTTGAWTLSAAGGGTCTYFWENSNVNGVTDFTYSATRVAGEGNVFRQDLGGDDIKTVEYYKGKYYSLKYRSAYELAISTTSPYIDLAATNDVFRKDMGLESWRASVATSIGIIFMNTSNPVRPQLTILEENINGDSLIPRTIANNFDFSKYLWNKCAMATYGEYIVFAGRTYDSATNNKLFMYNVKNDTVDILPYSANVVSSIAGVLYIGDVAIASTYKVLYGFTDNGSAISNHWISNDEMFTSETLKKVKKLRLKGIIQTGQTLEVYASYDNAAYALVGTVLGNGTYVDATATANISNTGIGQTMVGEGTLTNGYFYLAEIKLPSAGKFRKLKLKLTATGTGYVSVDMLDYFGISYYGQKLPSKYRSKQNVSTSGLLTDQ